MKRSVRWIVTVVLMISAAFFCACGANDRPVYDIDYGGGIEEKLNTFGNLSQNQFAEFEEYCADTVKEGKLFILADCRVESSGHYLLNAANKIFKTRDGGYLVKQYLPVYEKFNDEYQIALDYFAAPVPQETEGEVTLRFARGGEGGYYRYANVYVGSVCAGTCFYREGETTADEFGLEKYFKDKLRAVL